MAAQIHVNSSVWRAGGVGGGEGGCMLLVWYFFNYVHIILAVVASKRKRTKGKVWMSVVKMFL